MRGYSLIELGLVIAIVAILAGFAITSFGNTGETRDASMVQSAQASLQSIVSQGSVRQDVKPVNLQPAAVITAIQSSFGQGQNVTFTSSGGAGGTQYTMTIQNNRSATFQVTPTGDVSLIGINKFYHYQVDKSNAVWTIQKM